MIFVSFVVKIIPALILNIYRNHENSSTSTIPTNMPVTALLVLYAIAMVTAKATARYGAACASKRGPDMNSVIEIKPHKSAYDR